MDNFESIGLHAAARSGDLTQIKLLLNVGVEISAQDENDSTALHHAAECGKEQVVILLLERGADIAAVDNTGKTALHLAASEGHCRVVRRLLGDGADMAIRDLDRRTVLHLAASKGYDEVVLELLKSGADVLDVDNDRRTALHLASFAGYGMVVKRLLMHGADISAIDKERKKALHLAAAAGHGVVVGELLDRKADSPIVEKDWFEAVQLAVSAGHNRVVQKLLDYRDDIVTENEDRLSAVYWAASGGNQDLLKFLLEDADISQKVDGNSALQAPAVLLRRAPDDSILDGVERTIPLNSGVDFPSSQLVIPGMPDGALVLAEFVYQCHSQKPSVPLVSVCGQWDNYQHIPMTLIGDIDLVEEFLFATTIQIPAGHYSYFFEVDGVKLRDPSSTEDGNDSIYEDPTVPFPRTTPWPPVIIGNDESPQNVFKLQFRRLLKSIGVTDITAVQNPSPEITVFSSMRLTFSETRLPGTWMFKDTNYTIGVQFNSGLVGVDSPRDASSKVFEAMKRAWTLLKISQISRAHTPIGVQDPWDAQSLELFILFHQEQLSKLRNVTYIGAVPLCFEGEDVKEGLVVITTDWEASKEIEQALRSGEWEGKPIYVARDEWKYLHKEPPYLDKVLVGARGGGDMTVGVILCDRNQPETRYMVQCAHGYRRSGIGSQCCYPPPNSCKDALNQTARERATEESIYEQSRQSAAAEKARLGWNIWQPAGIVISGINKLQAWPRQGNGQVSSSKAMCLAAREEILKSAGATVSSDDNGVFYASEAQSRQLSIGAVVNLSTAYSDIALVKLHLADTYGIERSFNSPPNLLKPPWAISPARHTASTHALPSAITALSTSAQSAAEAELCVGASWLGKMGAATGFTQFYIDDRSVILLDGKRKGGLVPLKRGNPFQHDTILDEGDSSAPVFDSDGVMYGLVTAKLGAAEIGFMVLWSEAARCIEEWGYDLILA